MEIFYVYMYLARGPQLTVRFVGLAAHTAALAHLQHGLEDRQYVMPELAEKLLVTSNLFLSHLSKLVISIMLTQTLIATV